MTHHEIGSFVSFLVTRLGNLLIQEYRFLHGVKAQVEQMQTELNLMQCYLKAADTKREDGDEIVRNLYSEIRELSFDAEDVIATFLVKVALKSRGGIFNESRARHKVGLEIEEINKKIAHFTKSLKRYGIPSIDALGELSTSRSERESQLRRSYAHVFEEDIVGFDNDVKAVVDKLVNEKTNCRVVAIWGMGGLGKTTLAKMIYTNYDVRRHFDCIAWAYISQQCKTREVLEEILIKLLLPISEKERKEIENLKLAELTEKLHRVQSQKKCLVILDDIWERGSWARLSPGFPNTKGVVGSKILLTTRIREVALYVDQQCFLHELRLLTEKESWELFQKKASPRREEFRLSKEMMAFGKDMLKQCGGLPLAIVVLGGLLATKRTLGDWEKVSKSVDYLRAGKGPGEDLATSVLAISYNDLPYHLKACFLCLSDLPGDEGIRPVKLVQKWIAEGFVSLPIPARVGEVQEETMLDVGMNYLHELYQRCMIQVGQLTRFSRRVKYYRLHDLMRDLCLLKAQEENFIKVVLMGEDSATASSSSTPSRRLAVYYRDNRTVGGNRRTGYVKPHKMDTILNHHKVRSCQFYFFGNKLEDSDWRHIESIFKGFELLTFLDLERTTFSGKGKKLPKAVGNLIHLRYLSTRDSEIVSLPSSIGDLEFLQTLDLRNIYYTITIANELWRLKELRHLYLPQNIDGPFVGKLRLDGLSKLETLEGFKADNCDDRCFSTLTNLRQLGISRAAPKDLAVILKSPSLCNSNGLLRYSSFNILGGKYIQSQEDLSLLRQILGYRHLHKLKLFGSMNLSKLPDQFCPNLTKLILEESELEKDPMPTLEKLPNLRFLALDRDSYTGRKMVCSTPTPTTSSSLSGGGYGYAAAGFPQLKYLRLNGINNLEEWRLEKGAMPTLFRLQVKACLKLKEIPNGLRFVSTLQELVIDNVSQELQDRLKENLYIVQHVPSIKIEQGIP